MVSETEIITSFLLERINIKDALANERFKKMFPKNTPDMIIRQTRQNLIKRMDRRLAMVNSNIHGWEATQKRQTSKTRAENKESLDGIGEERKRKAKPATEKLTQISALLDVEIEELSSVYRSTLKDLKLEISCLNDIAYPSQNETSVQDETVKSIVDSLEKFRKT